MDNLEEAKEIIVDNSEQNKKDKKRVKRIFIIGFIALVFMVATYAWFVGTSSVTVGAFKVNISSSDGLSISLDGITFDSSVTVDEESVMSNLTGTVDDPGTYPTHKNHWVNSDDDEADNPGLIPISSSGVMDLENSVLKLYSKTSITSLVGGYRLVSDRITNYDDEGNEPDEKDGYVVFDLFIKNSSGNNYYTTYDSRNDEAVYLQTTSNVELSQYDIADDTSSSGGDGLENSTRVAFMQIARTDMSHDTVTDNAQDLTCNSNTNGDVALCNKTDSYMSRLDGRGYTWNIWEPNDMDHTADSISHFERICQKRTVDVNSIDHYANVCTPVTVSNVPLSGNIVDNAYVKTYAVYQNIDSNDNVNIYDGLNGYTGSTTSNYIKEMEYFTDTIKDKVYASPDDDHKREAFMYLAPNSITKIRVYIWLEGQDVDNYDISSTNIGLTINFGFSKDQFDLVDTTTNYTITTSLTGNGSGSVVGAATDVPAGSEVTLTAVPESGSVFAGWTDGNLENPRVISTYADEEYTAIFITSTGTYVYAKANDEDWGTVTGSGAYNGTDPLTLIATANDGYTFVKWSDNTTDSTYSYSPTATGYQVITAIFEPNDYDITVGFIEGQSSYCHAVTNHETVAHGNSVSIKGSADTGYRFKNWTYGEINDPYSAANPFRYPAETVTTDVNPINYSGVRTNMLFIANCVKVWTVNVTLSADSPANSGTVSVRNKTVDQGSNLTITATPNAGFHFVKWVDGDDETMTSSLTLTNITEAHTITAEFAADE